MTEAHCDDYMTKLNEIDAACNTAITTTTLLNEKIDELDAINDSIETDIVTGIMPITLAHLEKYIILNGVRRSRRTLISKMTILINLKIQSIKARIIDNLANNTDALGAITNQTNYDIEINGINDDVDDKQALINLYNLIKDSCINAHDLCDLIKFESKNIY